MNRPSIMIIALTSVMLLAGSLAAKPALKDVAHVREGIITAGMAYEISERCDEISVRLFAGFNYLNSLKNHARSLGYSDTEIDAYTDDRAEKTRLEGIARARLADRGVVPDEPQSYCMVGQAEIAGGTAIGGLLR